jgi:hypothetical protein
VGKYGLTLEERRGGQLGEREGSRRPFQIAFCILVFKDKKKN